ncbi:hypothetical protein TrRE_jg9572, partial [Triparma retinervis]
MSTYTLERIIDECIADGVKRSKGQAKTAVVGKKTYYSVWDSYNAWLLEKMLKRKGAECPSLANISWEFFSKATDPSDPETFTMRCKPCFVLSDAFMKANNIPKKKGAMLPTLAPSEMINFHKLALRYSTSLTKDMIFTTFTSLVRKIGEIIGSGRIIKLPFSVGYLLSKDKKTKFIFNSESLKIEGGENPVVFSMKKPAAPAADPLPSPSRSVAGQISSSESMSKFDVDPSSASPQEEDAMASTNAGAIPQEDYPEEDAMASTNAGAIPQEDYLEGDAEGDFLPLEGASATNFAAQEEAYNRYIAKLENDAVAENKLNMLLVEMQKEKDEKQRIKEEKAVQLLKDMQTSQLEQWAHHDSEKEKEIQYRKAPSATSFYPRMDEKEEDLGRAKIENPYGVPVTRQFLGLPGVPKKGMGYRLSQGELVKDLDSQISLKKRQGQAEKAMKEEEERRYIEHIAMELDYDLQARQLEARGKKRELMAAWQREAFLKKMKELRMRGDIEGLRRHHADHKMRLSGSISLPGITGGGGGGGGG